MLHYSTPPPRRQRENTPQTRTVRLTQDGMKLLPHAQRLIAEYERLQVQVDELNGLQSGLIRIDRHALAAAIIKEFQRDSLSVDCEPLLSDYTEIEAWIVRGARGLRFPALPVKPEPETVFLMRDPLMAILPEDHPLHDLDAILSMAESGLGVSVLPQLILRRIPYRAAIRPLFSRLS